LGPLGVCAIVAFLTHFHYQMGPSSPKTMHFEHVATFLGLETSLAAILQRLLLLGFPHVWFLSHKLTALRQHSAFSCFGSLIKSLDQRKSHAQMPLKSGLLQHDET
jgi:hypothetical protein